MMVGCIGAVQGLQHVDGFPGMNFSAQAQALQCVDG
jgi:hypothetical protein